MERALGMAGVADPKIQAFITTSNLVVLTSEIKGVRINIKKNPKFGSAGTPTPWCG